MKWLLLKPNHNFQANIPDLAIGSNAFTPKF